MSVSDTSGNQSQGILHVSCHMTGGAYTPCPPSTRFYSGMIPRRITKEKVAGSLAGAGIGFEHHADKVMRHAPFPNGFGGSQFQFGLCTLRDLLCFAGHRRQSELKTHQVIGSLKQRVTPLSHADFLVWIHLVLEYLGENEMNQLCHMVTLDAGHPQIIPFDPDGVCVNSMMVTQSESRPSKKKSRSQLFQLIQSDLDDEGDEQEGSHHGYRSTQKDRSSRRRSSKDRIPTHRSSSPRITRYRGSDIVSYKSRGGHSHLSHRSLGLRFDCSAHGVGIYRSLSGSVPISAIRALDLSTLILFRLTPQHGDRTSV
jgi:hypothetical protein